MSNISPKALVESGAQIAEDVRIGPFSYVGPHVSIGRGCVIENNVTLTGRTTLGEGNHVFPMAAVGLSADGAEAEEAAVEIGDANALREHVTVFGGTRRPTRVGSANLLMIDSAVGAEAKVGDHCILANLTLIGAAAVMEDYTHTSGFTAIEDGVRVGSYTFILGYAEIDRDAPPFAMIQGAPYRVRGVNTHKLRQCGFGEADIRLLKEAFRELFNGQGQSPAPEALRRWSDRRDENPHLQRLLESFDDGEPNR